MEGEFSRLTDNGRVFTGRFVAPPVELLFDRICRENGIEHLLSQPRSPTRPGGSSGSIGRLSNLGGAEFDTTRVFTSLRCAQGRDGDGWVSRKVGPNGIVCVAWQQGSIGKHRAGSRCDVYVSDAVLQFRVGSELLKTVTRTSTGR